MKRDRGGSEARVMVERSETSESNGVERSETAIAPINVFIII